MALAARNAEKRVLPPKETALFKTIARHYDMKQYKKGVKAADAILKKFPQHGETLAMKGLSLNCMGKKEEAHALVKEGIRYDMTSHVVWHVFGLLHRTDRNYPEAVKSYRNALKHDPDNQQILRDMALLQVQQRDCSGFVDTITHLANLKSNQRSLWVQMAIAHQLNNNPKQAIATLEAYDAAADKKVKELRYEKSEIALYKNMLIEETGDLEAALKQLQIADKEKIVDLRTSLEKQGEYLMKLGKGDDAASIYKQLLEDNPDNRDYIYQYLQATGAGEDPSRIVAFCDELAEKFPRSLPAKRIPLDHLNGDQFSDRLKVFLSKFLNKGIPSAFSNVSALYKDSDKAVRIEKFLNEFIASKETQASQVAHTWSLAFLARHNAHLGATEKALEAIERAISVQNGVDPDIELDLFNIKAEILHSCGAYKSASEWTEAARKLDLADRFVNCNSVRQLFAANDPRQADKVVVLFTKDGDQPNNLYDMQATWYERAAGDCYLRLKDYGRALKKYLAIETHFRDIIEDQFDFHSYCARKVTLRSYARMLKVEDALPGHDILAHGVLGAVWCYIALFKKPPLAPGEIDEDNYKGMSEAEKKKQMRKDKKAAMKAKAAAEEAQAKAAETAKKLAGKKNAMTPTLDEDPNGQKLIQTKDPLGEAHKLIRVIWPHRKRDVPTCTTAAHLYTLKKKYLLALRALRQAVATDPQHYEVRVAVTRFLTAFKADEATVDPLVKTMVHKYERELLGGESDLAKYATALASRSLRNALGAARSQLILDPSAKSAAAKTVLDCDLSNVSARDIALGVQVLREDVDDAEALKTFKENAKKIFPRADVLQ